MKILLWNRYELVLVCEIQESAQWVTYREREIYIITTYFDQKLVASKEESSCGGAYHLIIPLWMKQAVVLVQVWQQNATVAHCGKDCIVESPECSNCKQWAMHNATRERNIFHHWNHNYYIFITKYISSLKSVRILSVYNSKANWLSVVLWIIE